MKWPERHTHRGWAYIKRWRPGARETDKLESVKKKERQKIYRLRAEIVCGLC